MYIEWLFTGEVNGNAMTPSSRVSAINIVGDLLRKVGVSNSTLMNRLWQILAVGVVVALAYIEVSAYSI